MKKFRLWAKSFVWRIIGIWLLGLISWFVTHSWTKTTLIVLSFHVIRVLLYYIHEDVWGKIPKKHDKIIFISSLILLIISFILIILIN